MNREEALIRSMWELCSFLYCPMQPYYKIQGKEGKEMRHHRRGERRHNELDIAIRMQEQDTSGDLKAFTTIEEPAIQEKPIPVTWERPKPLKTREMIEKDLTERLLPFDNIAPKKRISSRKHMIMGEPDLFMVYEDELAGFIVPIEVKTGRPPRKGIYRAHMIQEAAYCMIMESEDSAESNHSELCFGIVYYPWAREKRIRSFDMTDKIRHWVLDTRDEIARMKVYRNDTIKGLPREKYIPRVIKSCRGCEFNYFCPDPNNRSATEKAEYVV